MFEREYLRRGDAPARRPEHAVQRTAESELLELQRKAGNAAVTTMVQRDAYDRPASTDNPGAKKKKPAKDAPKQAAKDVKARVLKFEIDKDGSLVTLSAGSEAGVKVGMQGSMLEKGKEYADFTVEQVSGGWCKAHVPAIQDQINRGPDAIIKASKFKEESQAGKEY